MEKLIYTHQKISGSPRRIVAKILISILTAICMVQSFAGCFGISIASATEGVSGFRSGLAFCWNQIGETLLRSKGFVLKEAAGAGNAGGIFLVVLILITAALVFLILQVKNPWLLLIGPALLCVGSVWLKLEPGVFWGGCLLGCILAGFLEMKMTEGIRGWQLVYVAILVFAVLGVFSYEKTADWIERPDQIKQADKALREKLHDLYYGENLLADGAVTAEKRVTEDGKTALTVVMEHPEPVYLRGYVGEIYRNGQWNHLPATVWKENKNLFYWLEQDGFVAAGQLGLADRLVNGQTEIGTITIETKDADAEYAYLPYTYMSTEAKVQSWCDAYLTAPIFGRMKTYTYQAGATATDRWTDIAGGFFTKEETDEMSAYLLDESYYNGFVYSYDTYLTNGDRELLQQYVGDAGDQSKGHIEYKTAIEKVKTYLDEQFLYTDHPALQQEDGESILEAFLEQGKGYDVHYATLATLLFRYYGIPARYVEGYLVTPEDVAQAEPGTEIAVSRGRIHAWTEIYVDGIGYVPIEVSPAYADVMPEADMTIGIDNSVIQKSFESSSGQTQTMDTLESGEDTQTINKTIAMALYLIFLLLILCILCYVLYRIIRKLYQRRVLVRLFKDTDHKLAVCVIFSYMEVQEYRIHEAARKLGNKAAYSGQPVTEQEHRQMLVYMKEMKVGKKNEKKNKSR